MKEQTSTEILSAIWSNSDNFVKRYYTSHFVIFITSIAILSQTFRCCYRASPAWPSPRAYLLPNKISFFFLNNFFVFQPKVVVLVPKLFRKVRHTRLCNGIFEIIHSFKKKNSKNSRNFYFTVSHFRKTCLLKSMKYYTL